MGGKGRKLDRFKQDAKGDGRRVTFALTGLSVHFEPVIRA